jgi:two-component system CheB/CheR fusion protein
MNGSTVSVVGIGASAGGLEAFHSFFAHVPPECGLAFVLILHLPADRTSMLSEILRRWTTMPVIDAEDGTSIEPNCVYVPPPHAIVKIADSRLRVETPEADERQIPRPIDAFFDSLASSLQTRAVGVVLSGTGSDGALGIKAIKEVGGLTIAQGRSGTTPQYGEMPAGAIATGAVDLVAAVEEIPEHLLRIKGIEHTAFKPADSALPTEDAIRLRICDILRAQVGHDFSGYREATFLRRVQRRMQVTNLTTLEAYVSRLESDHNEVLLLFRDLLIRVTSFFRDQGAFETLEAEVIPKLFSDRGADQSVRVWVPGCATGEEAYSLAILLREHMDRLQVVPKVQLFATDIDEAAIGTARLGRYPATLLNGLSDQRRQRFFKSSHGAFLVNKEIRDLCTFSEHNLVRDPPFSRMNLVSCRNLLIYMNPELQEAVIPAFHYSLTPEGFLLLGGSEGTAKHGDLFLPLNKTARIFIRREGPRPPRNMHFQGSNTLRQQSLFDGARYLTNARSSSSGTQSAVPWDVRQFLAAPIAPLDSSPLGRSSSGSSDPGDVSSLQQQLVGTQEQLQSLLEEHQTALEELRSSNEELHSLNEELQSTNEELETSKEELQSLNEELHTVNVRLSEKIEELDATNSDLRNLFESTEIATLFLDRHLIIRSFTPAVASLYHLIPSDQGRSLLGFVSSLDYDRLPEDVAHVLQTLNPLERRIARADGSAHYIVRILPYREPDSTVTGVLMTFVDVSSIVRAEAALVEADLRKDVFLATLSHELRNPLAPIRTAARILESPRLQREELDRARAIIARQVKHMSSLLDDLLDVSRITRGSFVLKRDTVDVKTVIQAAVESVQGAAEAKQHTLRILIPEVPIVLSADTVRLTQVLTNLLTNAVKYTPPGGEISVGGTIEAGELKLFVRDNGIGLEPIMRREIFNMFARIPNEDRSEGGLGIGLALAKGLVELHGGRIDARSEGLGRGSEFEVLLPRSLIVQDTLERPDHEHRPSQSRRVLIADDNRDGVESLGMYLKLSGHEVHIAYSGAEALEVVARVRPEIAVLDIGMPGLGGYEVARHIREQPWGGDITLIALTGWGQAEDKVRALRAGFNHHRTKPADPEDLERLFPVSSAH